MRQHENRIIRATEQREVSPRVADQYGTGNVQAEFSELRDTLMTFARYRKLFAIIMCTIFVLGMGYTLLQKHIYESTALVMVNVKKTESSTEAISLISELSDLVRNRSIETQVAAITSHDLLDEAFGKISESQRLQDFGSLTIPDWAVTISARPDTDIIVVTARAYSPIVAAKLANFVVQTYFERDQRQNREITAEARRYVEEHLHTVSNDLNNASLTLANYKKRSGLIAPDAQLNKTAEQLASMQQQLSDAQATARSSTQSVGVLRQELAREQTNVVGSSTVAQNPRFQAIKDRIDQLNSERANLLLEYLPTAPEVVRLDKEIANEEDTLKHTTITIVSAEVHSRNPVRDQLLTNYANSLSNQAASAARIQVLQTALQQQQRAAAALPEQERQLTELMSRVSLLRDNYEMLVKQAQQLEITEKSTLPNGRWISHALTPRFPTRPNLLLNTIVILLFGGVLATAVIFVANRLDDRIRDQEMAVELTGDVMMATIPRVDPANVLLTDGMYHDSLFSESFRILHNNIASACDQEPHQIVAITSPGVGEGKSTIVANLAIAMASAGKRVLILDGNLRRPSVHRLFTITKNSGSPAVVNEIMSLMGAVLASPTNGVSILPVGMSVENLHDMLKAPLSRQAFTELANEYDIMLVDCPSSTGLSDIQMLVKYVDKLFMVVSIDETTRAQLQSALNVLAQVNAPVSGFIANKLDPKSKEFAYYAAHFSKGRKKQARGKK